MSNPPEKIWTGTGLYYTYVEDWSEGWWRNNDDQGGVEYTRTDQHLALVAAAYERAWRVVWPHPLNGPPRKPAADDGPEYRRAYEVQRQAWRDAQTIRALNPDDAQAALERVKREALQEGYEQAKADETAAIIAAKREARNEALREAAELVTREGFGAVHDKILALMKDTDDE